ncbi:hypothetical protein X975_18169, partial [Stegodyphus mimosarum]
NLHLYSCFIHNNNILHKSHQETLHITSILHFPTQLHLFIVKL